MALRSADFYWLECDECGVKSTENSDVAAWGEIEHAVDEARDSEWCIIEHFVVEKSKHYCSDCRLKLPQSLDCFKDKDPDD